METLSSDNKDKLLIRLLTQGRGSLEFARNMLTESADPQPEPGENDAGRGVFVAFAEGCPLNRKTCAVR